MQIGAFAQLPHSIGEVQDCATDWKHHERPDMAIGGALA